MSAIILPIRGIGTKTMIGIDKNLRFNPLYVASGFVLLLVAIFSISYGWPFREEALAVGTKSSVRSDGTYLEMQEIGVSIKLDEPIKDAVYAPFEVQSADNSKVYGISSMSLIESKEGNEACEASSGPLGLVIASPDPITAMIDGKITQLNTDNKTLFRINNTYFRYVPPQNFGCVGEAISVSRIQDTQLSFFNSFSSLQAGVNK